MKKLYNIYLSNGKKVTCICSQVAETEAEAVFQMCNEWYYRIDSDKYKAIEHIETIRSQKAVYEHLALSYAEKYGIVEYHLSGTNMIYYSSFPGEHNTIKAVVDLDTNHETRTSLKYYYKSYSSLIAGKYQANYCV